MIRWLAPRKVSKLEEEKEPTLMERIVDAVRVPKGQIEKQILEIFQGEDSIKTIARLEPRYGVFGNSVRLKNRVRPSEVTVMVRPRSIKEFIKQCDKRKITGFLKVRELIKRFNNDKTFFIRIKHTL